MSFTTAFSFPSGALEIVQATLLPNSAIWKTGAGWTTPAQFTNDGDPGVIAACNPAGGDPCVFIVGTGPATGGVAAPSTVSYLTLTQPGTDASGAEQWQDINLPPGGVFDLCAAELPDGTVQVFALEALQTSTVLMSCWQSTAGQPSPTKHAFNTMTPFEPALPGQPWANMGVRVVTLPDGRLQLWGLTTSGPFEQAQQIVTCYKTTTEPGAAWSNWSTVASSGPNLSLIAGALGPVANEILLLGFFDPITGTWTPSHMQRIYLFGVVDGGGLVMASITPNATTPSPSGIVWTPVTLPPGLTTVGDLAVIPLANGGIQVFVLSSEPLNSSNQAIVYTQSLKLAELGPTFSGLRYWTWSDWEDLLVYAAA